MKACLTGRDGRKRCSISIERGHNVGEVLRAEFEDVLAIRAVFGSNLAEYAFVGDFTSSRVPTRSLHFSSASITSE